MKTAYINRGLPGSGKSTRARRLVEELLEQGRSAVVCSSDDFFTCPSCRNYNFTLDKLGFAHQWCQAKFNKALGDGTDAVIVDNTNVTANECRRYVEMAQDHGYEVVFLEPETPWAFDIDQLVVKNTHCVPRHALQKMLKRWVPDMTVEKALAGSVAESLDMHEDEAAATKGMTISCPTHLRIKAAAFKKVRDLMDVPSRN